MGIAVAEPFMDKIIPDRFKRLIRRNTTIPTSREEKFYAMYPDQDTIEIKVYQGEHHIAQHLAGKFPRHRFEISQPRRKP